MPEAGCVIGFCFLGLFGMNKPETVIEMEGLGGGQGCL